MEWSEKEILKNVKRGESETAEFKQTFDRETIETLCVFANAGGGRVFVGVSAAGKITGIDMGKETLQNWINQVKLSTSNAVIPDADAIKVKGKTVIVLTTPEHPIKPVACRGRYFKRIKNANHLMSTTEVVNEHLKTFNSSWDCYADEFHSENDISFEKIRMFIDRVNRSKEVPILDDPMTVLKKFELLRDGKITRAAFFLFMSGESSLSCIELGRFQTPIIIKDGTRLKTDLFAEVDGVMDFIKKHINKAFIITGRPQREERWDYPLDALREIVVNAIVHRDYSSSSDSVVKIYDNEIEFFNPGRLPEGLSIEKLLKGEYISVVRNKKIADMFKEVGLIEKYGTGIRRILDAFRNYGLPDPRFDEFSGGFRVTVYKQAGQVATAEETGQVTGEVTGEVAGEVTGEVHRFLGVLGNNSMTRLNAQTALGLKGQANFRDRYLKPALKAGLIEMTIPDKPRSSKQKYRLTEKGQRILKNL